MYVLYDLARDRSLRSWAHVRTSQLERALLFRTFALSVWGYVAR
eukprot:SAG31_NODE_25297_length_464_cov_0.904110_1_plen_43_part_10